MTTWIISGWVHLIIGFLIGWIFLRRPEWVETFISWVKDKVGL